MGAISRFNFSKCHFFWSWFSLVFLNLMTGLLNILNGLWNIYLWYDFLQIFFYLFNLILAFIWIRIFWIKLFWQRYKYIINIWALKIFSFQNLNLFKYLSYSLIQIFAFISFYGKSPSESSLIIQKIFIAGI